MLGTVFYFLDNEREVVNVIEFDNVSKPMQTVRKR